VTHEAPWRELIARIAADRISGASALARDTARALLAFAHQEAPSDLATLRLSLQAIAHSILAGQPSMASLLRILNDAMVTCARATSPDEALNGLQRVCQAYESALAQATERIAEHVWPVISAATRVVTISHSSVVARSLAKARQQGAALHVICLESRPACEGRELASYLAQCGLEVELAVDAAAYEVLEGADLWLAGADSLTEHGVVNKIGTAPLAAAARERGVPGYILCDRSKVWPSSLGRPSVVAQEADEVWAGAPPGVRVRNCYFDLTPWHLIAAVVDDEGLHAPDQIIRACRAVVVDEGMAAIITAIRQEANFV